MGDEPSYSITPLMVQQVAEIVKLVTRWSASDERRLTPQLRRSNRIPTIHAFFAIENNTMSRCRVDNERYCSEQEDTYEIFL